MTAATRGARRAGPFKNEVTLEKREEREPASPFWADAGLAVKSAARRSGIMSRIMSLCRGFVKRRESV
jgi:hypothetical protein